MVKTLDLIIILSDYPECIMESAKLKAILADLFPDESKGFLNVMVTIAKSGIAQEIRNVTFHDSVGKMEISRWVTRLETEYCMSGATVRKCLDLWVQTFRHLYHVSIIPCVYDGSSRLTTNDIIGVYLTNLSSKEDMDEYINNCFLILERYRNHSSPVYYELATMIKDEMWNIIRWNDCDTQEAIVTWKKDFAELIENICKHAEIKSTSIHFIIEQLLLKSLNGYDSAIVPLCCSYLYVVFLDEPTLSFYSKYSEGDMPWFDINCLAETNVNILEGIEKYIHTEPKKPSKKIREFYANKAVNLFNETSKDWNAEKEQVIAARDIVLSEYEDGMDTSYSF